MRFTIGMHRRVPLSAPRSGFTTVPDGTLSGEIELRIDERKLLSVLGPRALRSKGKRATGMRGAIVVVAHHLQREGNIPDDKAPRPVERDAARVVGSGVVVTRTP